jgi:hypothetical protein
MTTYVIRHGILVEKQYAAPKVTVQIVGDIPAYVSPVCDASGKHAVIDGRAAQREDLKRNNCRIKEPSERLSVVGVPKRPEPVVTESMMRTMIETYERAQSR